MKQFITQFTRHKHENGNDTLTFDTKGLTSGRARVAHLEGVAFGMTAVEGGKGRTLFRAEKPLAFHLTGSYLVSVDTEKVVVEVPQGESVMLSIEELSLD